MSATCRHCGGVLQASVTRYMTLDGDGWVDAGIGEEVRIYCESDCSGVPCDMDGDELPDAEEAVDLWAAHVEAQRGE